MSMMMNPWMNETFGRLRRLQDELHGLVDENASRWRNGFGVERQFPPINLWTSAEAVHLTAELPGVEPDSLDIEVREGLLMLRGERKLNQPGDDARWHRRERYSGQFARSIELPFEVDPDQVEAHYRDGVLHLTLNRPENARPRKIEVKA